MTNGRSSTRYSRTSHAVRKAYLRLLIGIVKLTVVATVFLSLYQQISGCFNTSRWQHVSNWGEARRLGIFSASSISIRSIST